MKFFETSKYFSLKKSTYIDLRSIAIIGQLTTINIVYFFLNFEFNFILVNLVILVGGLSNLYLAYIHQKTQLIDKESFFFLLIDILQLSCLIYLTGGIANPFSIFLIIPTIFSSSNLGFRSNLLLVSITALIIIFLTFFYQSLPYPVSEIIIKMVITTNNKLLFKPKFDDEKIVGIIKKIEKGFVIPPVK